MDVKERIREFFSSVLSIGPDTGDDVNVFELGFVNSLAALRLIRFVETAFSLRVEPVDLDVDNFNTVNRLATFIHAKQSAISPHRAAS